jgi:P27 family predicted phage terminase small subunit
VLAAYCDVYARWVEASEHLQRYGMIIKGANGQPTWSPYLAIVNRALELMRAFMCELGLTPSSRTRIDAEPVREPNKLDKLIERARRSREDDEQETD